jgi:hypothetical protein
MKRIYLTMVPVRLCLSCFLAPLLFFCTPLFGVAAYTFLNPSFDLFYAARGNATTHRSEPHASAAYLYQPGAGRLTLHAVAYHPTDWFLNFLPKPSGTALGPLSLRPSGPLGV